MKIFKYLLGLLPFDGDKTKIFGVITVATAAVQGLGIDPVAVAEAVISNPTKTGLIGLAVALVHKILKKKYPEPRF